MPQTTLTIPTTGRGLTEFTADAAAFVRAHAPAEALLTLFVRHTSCSLLIQENADPDVCADLDEFFQRIAPEDMSWIRHRAEGPDDMPAHIRAALTQTSLGVPVADGVMALGTWQGIYLFEHRRGRHERKVVLHLSA